MKGFDVLKVKSAVKNHNKFDLSRTHLTTMDFGQIVPLLSEETVPGDNFNIGAEYFSRLAPLAVPTYGKFAFKTVAAFVPYFQVAEDCDAWFAGKTVWEGSTPVQRCITISGLHSFIYNYCATVTANATDAEYVYVATNGNLVYRKFSNQGRYWVKILNSLGYALPENCDMQTTSTWYISTQNIKLSAYPLLAFFKLYNDYMSQSQRFNTSTLSSILQNIKYNKSFTGYSTSTGVISYTVLKSMFDALFLNYENDYFTSAWQNPNAPLSALENVNFGTVPGDYAGTVDVDNHNTYNTIPVITSPSPDHVNVAQRALDFLKDFDDWVRRNNYSGSRAVQQIYSRFGIKTDDYKTHYAQVLTTDEQPVSVGDVMSTSDTSGAILGEYAGKGIMSGGKGISCKVSDYGIILILGTCTLDIILHPISLKNISWLTEDRLRVFYIIICNFRI